MESSNWRRLMPARIGNIVIVLAFVLVIAVVLLAAFRPNRGANLFDKAQRLEAAGQWEQALGHYRLLVEIEPASNLAPRALMQQGAILEGMARRSGRRSMFQKAIDIYQQVSQRYPSNALAGESLLDAANLAVSDLNDYSQAAQLYARILDEYPRNGEYVSQATLALGRIALAQQNAELAQKYFQLVIQHFDIYPDRCAEAQYQLGVVAETLTRQPAEAKDAYQQTIKSYPSTVWATNAKARLGMLFYGDIAPGGPARRVMTRVSPLPDTGYNDNSPYLPLALALSARGMDVGPATLHAWSLQPFFTGFDEENPERVVQVSKGFENAVANAGLSFSVQSGADGPKAFNALREAFERGQTPVAFIGKWNFIVGYDTVAKLIFVQEQGAQIENMPIKDFQELWGKSRPRTDIAPRKPYTFLTFQAGNDQPKVTALKSAQSDQRQPQLFVTPSFELTLSPLSSQNADRRTVRRAAALLQRAHSDEILLNVEALGQLAKELSALGTLPPSPIPVPEAEGAESSAANPVDWHQRLQKATHLAPWFGKPLHHWIETRRDAAAYLERASRTLKDKRLQGAASELRHSIMALQNATTDFPDTIKSGSADLWTGALGQQLQRTAQDLREAQAAEAQAAKLLRDAS